MDPRLDKLRPLLSALIPDAHPHRYRDTFAVDMLARGANPYDVAKLLGDTVATVEKHYAPFVKKLRDRARRIIENGEGLEKSNCTNFAQTEPVTKEDSVISKEFLCAEKIGLGFELPGAKVGQLWATLAIQKGCGSVDILGKRRRCFNR